MILITAATIIVTITSIIRMSDFSDVAVSVYKIYYTSYIIGTSPVAQRVKNLPTTQETQDVGSIPGSGKSPGGGNGNPFQYSCLKSAQDRGSWWATVHGVAKSQKQMSG